MTIGELACETGCSESYVVKQMQEAGMLRRQSSKDVCDQTINKSYEDDLEERGGDIYWDGRSSIDDEIRGLVNDVDCDDDEEETMKFEKLSDEEADEIRASIDKEEEEEEIDMSKLEDEFVELIRENVSDIREERECYGSLAPRRDRYEWADKRAEELASKHPELEREIYDALESAKETYETDEADSRYFHNEWLEDHGWDNSGMD